MKKIKEVYNSIETYEFAKSLAKTCIGGEVFCLSGDLGVGKTVFTKGFANGIGIYEEITSPTFSIVNTYIGKLRLHHFDVYRINTEEELYDIGFEEYINDIESVIIIEWGELFKQILPLDTRFIKIEKNLEISSDYRKIIIDEDFSN